jgi:hypothetical protein
MVRPLLHAARCALATLLIALGAAQLAHAQANGRSGDSSQEYKRVLQEAMAEYERSNWAEARALFQAAHEMQPTARTLRAIGMCAFEEKAYVMAIAYLGQALSDTRKPLTADQRKQTEDALWRAREFVAKYRLVVTPSHAALLVDGHAPSLEEGKLLLDPGTHKLSFSADGYDTVEHSVSVRARETGELSIALVATGSSEAVAAAPAAATESSTPVAAAAPVDEPKSKLTKLQWVGVGLSGFGAVGLGLGIGFGVMAKNKHDESGCDSECPTKEDKHLNDQAYTFGNASTAMFAVGGAAAAAGIFLAVWAREKKPAAQQAFQWSPVLSKSFVGGTARAAW